MLIIRAIIKSFPFQTPNSPSPSDTCLYTSEVKRKFTFPQPGHEMSANRLSSIMSRSADIITSKKEDLASRFSLEWPDGHCPGQEKSNKETFKRKKSLLERLGVSNDVDFIATSTKSAAKRDSNIKRRKPTKMNENERKPTKTNENQRKPTKTKETKKKLSLSP